MNLLVGLFACLFLASCGFIPPKPLPTEVDVKFTQEIHENGAPQRRLKGISPGLSDYFSMVFSGGVVGSYVPALQVGSLIYTVPKAVHNSPIYFNERNTGATIKVACDYRTYGMMLCRAYDQIGGQRRKYADLGKDAWRLRACGWMREEGKVSSCSIAYRMLLADIDQFKPEYVERITQEMSRIDKLVSGAVMPSSTAYGVAIDNGQVSFTVNGQQVVKLEGTNGYLTKRIVDNVNMSFACSESNGLALCKIYQWSPYVEQWEELYCREVGDNIQPCLEPQQ